jgi:hypothetical protein
VAELPLRALVHQEEALGGGVEEIHLVQRLADDPPEVGVLAGAAALGLGHVLQDDDGPLRRTPVVAQRRNADPAAERLAAAVHGRQRQVRVLLAGQGALERAAQALRRQTDVEGQQILAQNFFGPQPPGVLVPVVPGEHLQVPVRDDDGDVQAAQDGVRVALVAGVSSEWRRSSSFAASNSSLVERSSSFIVSSSSLVDCSS